MRGFVLILGFFAVLGVGGGLLMLVASIGRSYDLAVTAAVPTLIGVMALVGVSVVLAIDEARKDVLAKLTERQ